jgi:PKD repeat protein
MTRSGASSRGCAVLAASGQTRRLAAPSSSMEGLMQHPVHEAGARRPAVTRLAAVLVTAAALALPATAGAQVPAPPNVPPAASFQFTPAQPVTGQTVTFTSTSTDSDGTIVHEAWDLSGDNTNDATGHTATWVYTQPGPHTVRLRARDNAGAVGVARMVVVVTAANVAPTAAFSFTPAAPAAGETVTFTSLSSDPEGGPLTIQWDLDHDGAFDDATGPTAARAFGAAGTFDVAVRATDDHGASSVALHAVVVRGAAPALDASAAQRPGSSVAGASPLGPTPSPGAPGASAPAGLLPTSASGRPPATISPFPVVRIRGHASGAGVVVDLLSVRAPRGVRVVGRCAGGGCPRGGVNVRAVAALRTLRIRALERRYAPGAVIEVFATLPGRIGKYVSFTIRRGRAPARRDRCIAPGGTRPIRCPAS